MKTGTSSDFRDNWCVGYTPEFTVGVWAGNFENQPMKNISGVAGAGSIFHRALVRTHRNTPPTLFPEPPGTTRILIDPRNGKKTAPTESSRFVLEPVPEGRQLPESSTTDYDSSGRALLPPKYIAWFNSSQNLRRHELALDETAANDIPLEIISPRPGMTVLLDPEIPGVNSYFRLITNLPDFITWSSATLEISGTNALLIPGVHTLIATDRRDSSRHTVTITVKTL